MTRAIQPTTKCADCGTTGGYVRPGRPRPQRSSGAPYGFSCTLCKSCTEKHRYRRQAGPGPYEPTQAEITRGRSVIQFGTPWVSRRLPILNPIFYPEELGTRAVTALVRREQRRNALRKPKPKPEAAPCHQCSTTGGSECDRKGKPRRYSGAAFGIAGLVCHACYNRNARLAARRRVAS